MKISFHGFVDFYRLQDAGPAEVPTQGISQDALNAVNVIVAILGVLVAVVGVYYARRSAIPPKKRLTVSEGQPASLLPDSTTAVPGVKISVTHNEQTIANPHITTLSMENTGRRDISGQDFDQGKPFSINLRTPIVQAIDASASADKSSSFDYSVKDSKIEIKPSLIQPERQLKIQVFTDGRPNIEYDSPLIDTNFEVRSDKEIEERRIKERRKLFFRRSALFVSPGILLLVYSILMIQVGHEVADRRILFSAPCQHVISMGENDECVREVQTLLKQAGANVTVDAAFGPGTQKRVMAFQLFADLPLSGVVDDNTKRALYEGKVKMTTWSPQQVEQRIRQVFPESPDEAVGIARCHSNLDPLNIQPNSNGTRNWGLFQIYEGRFAELWGTPRQALDPEWNIRAARQLWSKHHDFRDWQCSQASRPISPAPTSPGG